MSARSFECYRMQLAEKAGNVHAAPVTYVSFGDNVTQGFMEYLFNCMRTECCCDTVKLCLALQRSINKVAVVDFYSVWHELEAGGKDIHPYLANGINHPNRTVHKWMAAGLQRVVLGKA